MKKVLILFLSLCISISNCNCQLLKNPTLTVEAFEKALLNSRHLKTILKKHNFDYTVGSNNFNAPGTITNPLIPDLRTCKQENWEQRNNGHKESNIVRKVNIYEWVPSHGPQPDVTKTIRIVINKDSIYSVQVNNFLDKIRDKYPNRSKIYFRNNELYQNFGYPYIALTNGTKIEVRIETVEISNNSYYYIVSFDLLK
jgi:hypothetical protein